MSRPSISATARSVAGRLLAILTITHLAAAASLQAGNKPTRPVTFKNPYIQDTAGHTADDLHVMMRPKGCGVKSTNPSPIGYTPQFGGTLQYFYGFSVPAGGSLTIEFECDKAPIDIIAWWWTRGGNHRRHGDILGKIHRDPTDTKKKVHAAGGPATGNGILRIAAAGAHGLYSTTPGSSPGQTISELAAFVATLDAGEGPTVYASPVAEDLLYLDAAIHGELVAPLAIEVLQSDDTQDLQLWSVANDPAFSFGLRGGCPEAVATESVGSSPGATITLYAGMDGAGTVPDGPCAGTELDLVPSAVVGSATADEDGATSPWIDSTWCGTDILIQAIDESTCTRSSLTGL